MTRKDGTTMNGSNAQSPLELIRDEIAKCIECGTCLHSCPVYRECHLDVQSPRGRNRLLRSLGSGEEIFNYPDLATVLQKCLLCGRCASGCPRGVRSDLVVEAARGELIRRQGLPLVKRVAFRKIMADRSAMAAAVRAAGKMQWLLPQTKTGGKLPQRTPLRHLPLFFLGLGKGCELPAIPDKFLREVAPAVTPAQGERKMRVAFFPGCATEYMLPKVGQAVLRLLASLGVEVVLPENLGCCGIAVAANGDAETAREMALRNLDILAKQDVKYVITACATCGSTLKEGWAGLFRGLPRHDEFAALGAKVRDFSELLVELANCKPLPVHSTLPAGTRVTYHDPCHLVRYQGVTEQPRRILWQVFGNDFVEMDYKGCCGCGGSFSLHSRDLSLRIGEEKLDAVQRTGAEVVVNTCPGCMIQLASGISRRSMPQQVLHLAEVVARD
jgi:glycolate oxidase iron-sulfur subunit